MLDPRFEQLSLTLQVGDAGLQHPVACTSVLFQLKENSPQSTQLCIHTRASFVNLKKKTENDFRSKSWTIASGGICFLVMLNVRVVVVFKKLHMVRHCTHQNRLQHAHGYLSTLDWPNTWCCERWPLLCIQQWWLVKQLLQWMVKNSIPLSACFLSSIVVFVCNGFTVVCSSDGSSV